MSFDPQDCEEMLTLASEHIEQLEAENKVLEESRDELLEAVTQSEIVIRLNGDIDKAEILIPIIKKAEDLKEKEETK